MRVRIAYTTTVTDEYRRAINLYYGKPGLASRDDVRQWLEQYGSSEDDNLMWDLSQADEEDDPFVSDLNRATAILGFSVKA